MTKQLDSARTGNNSSRTILNYIRSNASDSIKAATVPIPAGANMVSGIAKFGQAILGNAAHYNEFIAAMQAVAVRRITSLEFENPYASLLQGNIEHGAIAQDTFIDIPKPEALNKEEGDETIFKRRTPQTDVVSYVPNVFITFKTTVDDRDIARAFESAEGVANVISNITSRLYVGHEYSKFLMTLHLVIKAIRSGEMQVIAVDPADTKGIVKELRAISGNWEFPDTKWNRSNRKNVAKPADLVTMITPSRRADIDVDVLSVAFNMDKADFIGNIMPIKDFEDFDNDYFSEVYTGDDNFEPVTADDLARLEGFVALVADRHFFQIWQNYLRVTDILNPRTGARNFWLTYEGTYATSPFRNGAILFDRTKIGELLGGVKYTITGKTSNEDGIVTFSFDPAVDFTAIANLDEKWVQTQAATDNFTAIRKRLVDFGEGAAATVELRVFIAGVEYKATLTKATAKPGDVLTFAAVTTP